MKIQSLFLWHVLFYSRQQRNKNVMKEAIKSCFVCSLPLLRSTSVQQNDSALWRMHMNIRSTNRSTSVIAVIVELLRRYYIVRIKHHNIGLLQFFTTDYLSMGQLIKSVCVCLCVCVCLSVCQHSHGRISLSIFTKFDTEV